MVSPEAITAIEVELDQWCQGRWLRLTAEQMRQDTLKFFDTGWRIELNEGAVRSPEVTYLLLVVDAVFPNSQPRVFAPGMGSDYRWPHVEQHG